MTTIVTLPASNWTYTDLQASVISWAHRTDITSLVPDFISLAEDELNTELRLRLMEVDETLSVTAGARTVALPARYIEPVKLEINYDDGSSNQELVYLTMPQFKRAATTGSACEPQYWTINGTDIEFQEPTDRAYTMIFRMLKKFDIAATSTNALLTQYKGLYLYGALLQAAMYLGKDSRIEVWRSAYDRLLANVKVKEARSKTLATQRTDLPGISPRSNILRG